MSAEWTVFIVDDDLAAAASIHALLMTEGIESEIFASAEAFFGACDGRPNACLVLDIRLPQMSGLELQQALIDRGIKIPIVMISGHPDRETRDTALKNGAVAFLEKPFAGKELCEAVRVALTQR